MEREFKPPVGPPEASAPPQASEHAAPRKKEKPKQAEQAAEKAKTAESKPAEKPPKQKLGGRVLNMLFGDGHLRPESAEAPAPTVETPEQPAGHVEHLASEPVEHATRMRRFARRVIAHVLGEAAAEPSRARAEASADPLDTEPLVEAADDLRHATDDLDDTLHTAEEVLVYERRAAPEAAQGSPDHGGTYDSPMSERIALRVERLESRVDATGATSLAAVGLGVVAVLVAGHEYFARRRVEKSTKKLAAAHQELEKQVKKQQQEFVVLQKEQAAQMDRQHRQDYYERLSEFTHEQAVTTREVSRELQQNIEAAMPIIPEPLPSKSEAASQTPERQAAVDPLLRVENADTIERGGQVGNAGTGFFGGGMSGVGGRLQQAIGQAGKAILPPGKDRSSADAQRKARLASNAWLYSAGFVIAVTALVLSLIFST